MASSSLLTQADALLRKNVTFQKRNIKTTMSLIMFPAFLCILIVVLQTVVNSQLNDPRYRCGCKCIHTNGTGPCQDVCGLEYSTAKQAPACPILSPQEWPALLQVPGPQNRAVQTAYHNFSGLPNASCLNTQTCPVTSLFTGQNRSFAEGLVTRMDIDAVPENLTDQSRLLTQYYLGTYNRPGSTYFVEHDFLSEVPLHVIQPQCLLDFSLITLHSTVGSAVSRHGVKCVQSLNIWRETSAKINTELFQGYRDGNSAQEADEILVAYDFLNSSNSNWNINIWYNSTFSNVATRPHVLRLPRSINMVSNAFLRNIKDDKLQIQLGFIKEMPRCGHRIMLNLSSVGPLLFAWVIQLLFPVFLATLVYEKQHKLRIMMKMHGLRDGPYWLISYGYLLIISFVYMVWFSTLGSILGLEIFHRNSYSVQFIFYLVYLNLQIALAFFAAVWFSDAKVATEVGYIYVFGSGLMGAFFFQLYIEDITFPRKLLWALELLPGFSLYNGLYELSQYAAEGLYKETSGMTWSDLGDQRNGMKATLISMTLEWLVMLITSYYLDQVVSYGNGVARYPLSFGSSWNRRKQLVRGSSIRHRSTVFIELENIDISEERDRVDEILKDSIRSYPIVCHNLSKTYMETDGSSKKHAVQSLSLAIPKGECFGLLGPNGSGKTTLINMVTGFTSPTSGSAFVDGLDTRSNMHDVYEKIGICPQQDLIWEDLSGREHLLFYGRLRDLKGDRLQHEVNSLLRKLDLHKGNISDQLVSKYSGGMKRRLSVAISLVGNTKVIFMDEPTTGLDPESRNNLWQVIKQEKANRAIILTTHSMEEAEFLCDRVSILVDGNMRCLGSPKELRTRYGGSYLLSISTDVTDMQTVESVVRRLSGNVVKVYNVAGTQKFKLPKGEVRVSDIFQAIENLREGISVAAYGVTDASLEDVFINVVDGICNKE